MTSFSETLNETKGPQPTGEKKRCLGGIREMIRLSKSHIYKGLPQVRYMLHMELKRHPKFNVVNRFAQRFGLLLKMQIYVMKLSRRGCSCSVHWM